VVALNYLGQLYQEIGRPADAEAMYRGALSIREQALGPQHPQVAASLNTLAEFLASQHRFREAAPLLQRALEVQGVTIAS
jgi:Tfp pilus assembly protein PilF